MTWFNVVQFKSGYKRPLSFLNRKKEKTVNTLCVYFVLDLKNLLEKEKQVIQRRVTWAGRTRLLPTLTPWRGQRPSWSLSKKRSSSTSKTRKTGLTTSKENVVIIPGSSSCWRETTIDWYAQWVQDLVWGRIKTIQKGVAGPGHLPAIEISFTLLKIFQNNTKFYRKNEWQRPFG